MDSFNNSFALIIGIDDPELASTQDATDIHDVLVNKDFAGCAQTFFFVLKR